MWTTQYRQKSNQSQNSMVAGDSTHVWLESFFQTFTQKNNLGQSTEDPLLSFLGETTNLILYSEFRTNLGREFSRSDLREIVDKRKKSVAETKGFESAAKIQSGKLAVDYWIDFFVDQEVIEKRNSNPVMFKMVSDRIQGVAPEGGEGKPRRMAKNAA